MPIEMRGTVAYVARSKTSPVLGRDRRGYRGGSIVEAIADRDAIVAGHFVERDTRLIQGMRIVGDDRLTARDQAVYQLMLAVARERGIENDFHQIDTRSVARFLRARQRSEQPCIDARLARLRESVERLSCTIVRYGHRNSYGGAYAPGPLVKAAIHEDPVSGKAILDFSLADATKHAISTSRSYTWLELDAFAGFRSRYTPRLYQHLALRAGYDGTLGKQWKLAPAELARLLNYRPGAGGTFRASSFERRCLGPALADISREVRGFRVSCERRKEAVRGAPVEMFVFDIVPRIKPLHHHKAADVPAHLAPLAAAGRHSADHLPSRLVLGRAQTLTGHSAEALHEGWQVALERANADPQVECIEGLPGYVLLQTIRWQDADRAFAAWVEAVRHHGSMPAPVRIVLTPVTPDKLEPSLRALVEPRMRRALHVLAGRVKEIGIVQAMDTLLHASDETTHIVRQADAAIGGRLLSAGQHAAAGRLDPHQWGSCLTLLAGGRPREAIEAFDEMRSGIEGTTSGGTAPISSAWTEYGAFETELLAETDETDPLHEPPDLSNMMDVAEPPTVRGEPDNHDDPMETDAIPY